MPSHGPHPNVPPFKAMSNAERQRKFRARHGSNRYRPAKESKEQINLRILAIMAKVQAARAAKTQSVEQAQSEPAAESEPVKMRDVSTSLARAAA